MRLQMPMPQSIDNRMVIDELWEEPSPKACRICQCVPCKCEDF